MYHQIHCLLFIAAMMRAGSSVDTTIRYHYFCVLCFDYYQGLLLPSCYLVRKRWYLITIVKIQLNCEGIPVGGTSTHNLSFLLKPLYVISSTLLEEKEQDNRNLDFEFK